MRIAAVLVGSLLLITTLSQSVAAARKSETTFPHIHELSHVIGMSVENVDGRKLGKLKNFVVDLRSSRILYGIVSSGGLLGVRAHLKLVPACALSITTAKAGVASVDITVTRWQFAPEFKKGELPALTTPSRFQEISSYFRVQPGVAQPRGNFEQAQSELPATGRGDSASAQPASEPAAVLLTSVLIGMQIINAQAEKVGKAQDMFFDLCSSNTPLVIVSAPGRFKREGTLAAPLRLFSFSSKGKLQLNATPVMLESTQPFSEQAWQSNQVDAIYRYETR